ncbi:MAG: hypothetical protein HZA54_16710 [Planctomycetes bacterium]|nr:hypothetical protein [Planctomycetota bacterium]
MTTDAGGAGVGAGADDLFPSGPWVGFYTYRSIQGKHRMDLSLRFAAGRLSGDGTDPVGFFVLSGRYDRATLDVRWTKTYPGRHQVYYRGFREGRGIWGTWEIAPDTKGGFMIWPKGSGGGAGDAEEAAAPVEGEEAMVGVPEGREGEPPRAGGGRLPATRPADGAAG